MTSPFAQKGLSIPASATRLGRFYDGRANQGSPKIEAVPEVQAQAWRALLAAQSRITERVEADLAAIGSLSLGELELLGHLHENGGTMRMSVLAQKLRASRSGLTRRVDRLARQGLVTRRSAPEDKRGTYAVLTDAGSSVVSESMPHHTRSLHVSVFAGLTEEELATLTGILAKLARDAAVQDEASRA